MTEFNKKKTIRVLHCIYSLSGGGAERQLNLVVKLSKKYGFISDIFCVNDSGREYQDKTINIYKSRKSNKYNFSILSSFNNVIKLYRPDLVHVWLPEAITIPTMLICFIKNIPCVFSYRNMMKFRRPLSVLEYVLSIFSVTGIVSNNYINQSSIYYRYLYKIKNGITIHNAVQLDQQFRKIIFKKIDQSKYKMLYVGRITEQKNWKCMLKALPYIESRFKWELQICGDGEDRLQLIDMIHKLNLEDSVKWLGYRKDVYKIMEESDVLILPSKYEGMPNVFLEALEIGLPSIVSNIPAHDNIIRNYKCALTFDPNMPTDLADNINIMFGDETIGEKLSYIGRKVVNEYNPERMLNELYNYYSKILN